MAIKKKQKIAFKLSHRRLIWLLLILGFAIKIYRLDYPNNFYFDEVYHGFTATRMLHHDPQVYDPWAKPPEGVAFEWTHPPLAKLLMAFNMAIVGESSFGWRLGSVLFGTLAIALSGIIAFELTASSLLALLTVFFLSFEGLIFVQARIAMNDSYFLSFALFTILCYLRWRKDPTSWRYILATGLGLGLAAATKWTTAYLFCIIAIDLCLGLAITRNFPGKRLPIREFFVWILVPIAVYLVSYLDMFLSGASWEQFVELQRQMFYYHSNLKATHSYQSLPWQWLFNLRPVWMHVDYQHQGMIQNIYNIGNSVVLLGGLFAVIRYMWNHRNISWPWPWRFIALCYFMLWLPWSFSPRIMLFYHYLPAVPFLCMFLAQAVAEFLTSPSLTKQRLAKGLLVATVLWFLVFFPDMTGIAVPERLAYIYFAIPSWR